MEITDKLRGFEYREQVRKVTIEDLRTHKNLPECEHRLWVDAFAIERMGSYPNNYLAILLASHWGLVDKVYLNTLHLSGCSRLWRGPLFNVYIVDKTSQEECTQYF